MKLHLVDGTFELFRAHYGAPPATGTRMPSRIIAQAEALTTRSNDEATDGLSAAAAELEQLAASLQISRTPVREALALYEVFRKGASA